MGKSQWERGDPDYMGVHSFDNILQRLQQTVGGNHVITSAPRPASPPPPSPPLVPPLVPTPVPVPPQDTITNGETTSTNNSSYDLVIQRIKSSLDEDAANCAKAKTNSTRRVKGRGRARKRPEHSLKPVQNVHLVTVMHAKVIGSHHEAIRHQIRHRLTQNHNIKII